MIPALPSAVVCLVRVFAQYRDALLTLGPIPAVGDAPLWLPLSEGSPPALLWGSGPISMDPARCEWRKACVDMGQCGLVPCLDSPCRVCCVGPVPRPVMSRLSARRSVLIRARLRPRSFLHRLAPTRWRGRGFTYGLIVTQPCGWCGGACVVTYDLIVTQPCGWCGGVCVCTYDLIVTQPSGWCGGVCVRTLDLIVTQPCGWCGGACVAYDLIVTQPCGWCGEIGRAHV